MKCIPTVEVSDTTTASCIDVACKQKTNETNANDAVSCY